MDLLLGRVTQQAMNYAIRSGVTITASFALKQCGRYLKEAPRGKEREELARLQLRLESKIRIISPAIDMIELISARGNTTLESAVTLTKEIRYEIQNLGIRLSTAATDEELLRKSGERAKNREVTEHQVKSIISAMQALLDRIEDAVPLINLAITTSGVNLSTKLSGTISPSRLLQASTFLTAADSNFAAEMGGRTQVGPTYNLSMYMLFAGHADRPTDENNIRNTTWKEVIHKARLKLYRVPLDQLYDLPGEISDDRTQTAFRASSSGAEFAYQIVLIEDLDDDRIHTFEEYEPQPGPFDDVSEAGIRDILPIHEISKIFYADTGKILNIGADGETNSPVLLLKRDVHADPPRRMIQRSRSMEYSHYDDDSPNRKSDQQDGNQHTRGTADRAKSLEGSAPKPHNDRDWRLPLDLDPEWLAFEVYKEDPDSDSELDDHHDGRDQSIMSHGSRQDSSELSVVGALDKLSIRKNSQASSPTTNPKFLHEGRHPSPKKRNGPPIKTSLSLLEMLLKLAALQQFRQDSHLAVEDELLNFFLEDSATAGAGSDKELRQRVRHDAVKRVGFDPYDESPVKRRGEEYIQHARNAASPKYDYDSPASQPRLQYDAKYEFLDSSNPSRDSGRSEPRRFLRDAYMSSPSQRSPGHHTPQNPRVAASSPPGRGSSTPSKVESSPVRS